MGKPNRTQNSKPKDQKTKLNGPLTDSKPPKDRIGLYKPCHREGRTRGSHGHGPESPGHRPPSQALGLEGLGPGRVGWGGKGTVGRLRTFTNHTRTGRGRQFCGFPQLCSCDSSCGLAVTGGWNPVPPRGNRAAERLVHRQTWRWRREKSEHAGAFYIWQ